MAYTVDESYVPLRASKTIDGNGYDVEWVLVSDAAMKQRDVLNIEELPLLRSGHPDDPSVTLVGVVADPRDSVDPFKWTLVLTYASGGDLLFPSKHNDPTKWPAEISFDTYTYQQVVRKAFKANGKDFRNPSIDVENSASYPFKPGYAQPMTGETITISRNERDFNADDKKRYRNSINRGKVRIAGKLIQPYEGWMRAIAGSRKVDDDGEFYWTIVYEIIIKDWDKGWRVELLDEGFYKLEKVGNKVQSIRIKEWMIDDAKSKTTQEGRAEVTSAQKLDGAGALAAKIVDPVTNQLKIVSTYLTYHTYPPSDWIPLKLPAQEADHAYAQ